MAAPTVPTMPTPRSSHDALKHLLEHGWAFQDAVEYLNYPGLRYESPREHECVTRLTQTGIDRESAASDYKQLLTSYPDASEETIDTLIETINALAANRSMSRQAIRQLSTSRQLHLIGPLIDAGYSPASLSTALEHTSIDNVIDAVSCGLTPERLDQLAAAPRRTTTLGTVIEMLRDGLDWEILGKLDIDTLAHGRSLGLTYTDVAWLAARGVTLDPRQNWWSEPDIFAGHDEATRRLLAVLAITTSESPHELLPVAVASANQPWTETLTTLLADAPPRFLDTDPDRELVDLIVTARALENDPLGPPAPMGEFTPMPLDMPSPRVITEVSELSDKETTAWAQARTSGTGSSWASLRYWLATGMPIEHALCASAWTGPHTNEWTQTVSERTGTNQTPAEPSSAQWLAAALGRGVTLEDVRLLSSSYHSEGTIGPAVAARVLGLGIPLMTAHAWASRNVNIDTAALLTAYGVDEPRALRIAGLEPQARRFAALIASMGFAGAELETAIATITHWGSVDEDGIVRQVEPVSPHAVLSAARHGLTTSDLAGAGLARPILGGQLDAQTTDLALDLHARIGRRAADYAVPLALLAYAAATSGKPYARDAVKDITLESEATVDDVIETLRQLADQTQRARANQDAAPKKARSVRTPRTKTAEATGRAHTVS